MTTLLKSTHVNLIEEIQQFGITIPRDTKGTIISIDRQHGTLKYWISPNNHKYPVFFAYQSEIEII
jgi:hypothetical protein